MGIGDLDSGARFGLVPIGLPNSSLDTPGSDTERRAFPGLATKSSVFAWQAPTQPALVVSTAVAGGNYTVNMRNNVATGGSSVDVPTWAAGAVLRLWGLVNTMGTSTYHVWVAYSAISGNNVPVMSFESEATTKSVLGDQVQFVMPFYDEPQFLVSHGTNGTGTGTTIVYLVGFVRNV